MGRVVHKPFVKDLFGIGFGLCVGLSDQRIVGLPAQTIG